MLYFSFFEVGSRRSKSEKRFFKLNHFFIYLKCQGWFLPENKYSKTVWIIIWSELYWNKGKAGWVPSQAGSLRPALV
jgi:hypothetical protein